MAALYVATEKNLDGVEERVEMIHELKPHVSKDAARIAVNEIGEIMEESRKMKAH